MKYMNNVYVRAYNTATKQGTKKNTRKISRIKKTNIKGKQYCHDPINYLIFQNRKYTS